MGVAVLISLLLHLFGSLLFHVSGVTENPSPPKHALVTFLSPTAEMQSIQMFRASIMVRDPSASSLPHPRGFSSITIRRRPQVTSLIEVRQDNPQLLPRKPFDPANLSLVPEPALAELLAQRASKQSAFLVATNEIFEFNAPKTESDFTLRGAIRDRRLLSLANIPLVRYPAPSQPTVVRIAVSPLGDVKFAVLERSSGSEEKDARALDIIRRWRFEALPGETKDQWGAVSVYWAAEFPSSAAPAPSDTNRAPKETAK